MVAALFRKRDIVERVVLEKERTVTSSWYIQICLPKVIERLRNMRPRPRLDTWLLHHDNAPVLRLKKTDALLVKSGLTLLDHPPYSPDLAPRDFG